MEGRNRTEEVRGAGARVSGGRGEEFILGQSDAEGQARSAQDEDRLWLRWASGHQRGQRGPEAAAAIDKNNNNGMTFTEFFLCARH